MNLFGLKLEYLILTWGAAHLIIPRRTVRTLDGEQSEHLIFSEQSEHWTVKILIFGEQSEQRTPKFLKSAEQSEQRTPEFLKSIEQSEQRTPEFLKSVEQSEQPEQYRTVRWWTLLVHNWTFCIILNCVIVS